MLTVFLLAFLTSTFLLYYWYSSAQSNKSNNGNFPPGPRALPFLGNVHQLGKDHFQTFINLRKKYGDIIGFRFGSQRAIILNEYKLVREAFSENVFSGRQCNEFILERCGGGKTRAQTPGIIFTEGKEGSEQRRFTRKSLRDFGYGRKSAELMVKDEVQDLIETFKKLEGKPMSTQNKFNAAVLNALWTIMTGKRFAHDDPVLGNIIKRLTNGLKHSSRFAQVAQYFPFLVRLPFARPALLKFRKTRIETMRFLEEVIDSHKESHQENSARDFIDLYLDEIIKTSDPDSSFFKEEGENQLSITMFDMFLAGAETMGTTLSWTFLLLALNQKEQEKLFKEILKVIGNTRLPCLADRPSMPFTQATILEVLRFSSIVPLGITHKTMNDVKFHGYDIPAGTLVFSNLYCIHHDPVIWGDPENFKPSRFLSNDGKTVVRHEAMLPFSTGKRVCLGETLARDELFLFITSLVQRFHIQKDPADTRSTDGYIPAFIVFPKPHHLILTDRQKTSSF